ncbi:hypothetical protein J1614_004540 [Plenodomus biglobosus]|nr:hypothetical protein J1614_004540 [Plenodomus biglobosus]
MSNGSCPHGKDQDGVCGCVKFWEHPKGSVSLPTLSTSILPIRTANDIKGMRSPPPVSSGGPKATCFLWYHGQCERGDSCPFEHKTHIAWPIVPLPGFVHAGPCGLPSFPLRSGSLSLNEQNAKHRNEMGLGAQVDGAFMSRAATVDATTDEEEHEGRPDLEAVVATNSISDLADTLEEFHDANEAVAVSATSDQARANTDPAASLSPSPTTGNIEYLDMSGILSPPPANEGSDDLAALPSHSGTTSKRHYTPPSPVTVTQCKRTKREYLSVHSEKCLTKQLLPNPNTQGDLPTRLQKDPTHHLPPKPGPGAPTIWGEDPSAYAAQLTFDPDNGLGTLIKRTSSPNPAPDICFFHYHHGVCFPKRRRGRQTVCKYSHTDPAPGAKVSQPHNITNHRADCSLPLCPVRMERPNLSREIRQELRSGMVSTIQVESQEEAGPGTSLCPGHGKKNMRSYYRVMGTDNEPATSEQQTSIKYEPESSEPPFSSSPRDAITATRYIFTKGPTFNKNSRNSRALQLPKITGQARQRFKEQKKRIEQWQAENGIRPDDKETKSLNKRQRKRMKKETNRRRRNEMPMATGEKEAISLCYGEDREPDFTFVNLSAEATTQPDSLRGRNPDVIARQTKQKEPPKDMHRSRHARSLFQTCSTTERASGTIDPEVELYSQSFHPAFSSPETPMAPAVREGREEKRDSVYATMQGTQTTQRSGARSRSLSKGNEVPEGEGQGGQGSVRLTTKPGVKEYTSHVDYDLPVGDDRLDWDTDFVRRTFGEIE